MENQKFQWQKWQILCVRWGFILIASLTVGYQVIDYYRIIEIEKSVVCDYFPVKDSYYGTGSRSCIAEVLVDGKLYFIRYSNNNECEEFKDEAFLCYNASEEFLEPPGAVERQKRAVWLALGFLIITILFAFIPDRAYS